MSLGRRLVYVLNILCLFCLAGTANANHPSQLDLPQARTPSAVEQLYVPTVFYKADDSGCGFFDPKATCPPREKEPAPTWVWNAKVPTANRILGNCLFLRTYPDEAKGAVLASMANMCPFSLRMQASYGFKKGAGPCVTFGVLDDVIFPFNGSPYSGFEWIGPKNEGISGCLAEIRSMGTLDWTASAANSARAWIVTTLSRATVASISTVDADGNDVEQSTIAAVTSDSVCSLSIAETDIHRPGESGSGQRLFQFQWIRVESVEGATTNIESVSLLAKGGQGKQGWRVRYFDKSEPDPDGWNISTSATLLNEYCHKASPAARAEGPKLG